MLTSKVAAMVDIALGSLICVAQADNPIIQTIYAADPAPYVWTDTVWLFADHDKPGSTTYTMRDWRLFSSNAAQRQVLLLCVHDAHRRVVWHRRRGTAILFPGVPGRAGQAAGHQRQHRPDDVDRRRPRHRPGVPVLGQPGVLLRQAQQGTGVVQRRHRVGAEHPASLRPKFAEGPWMYQRTCNGTYYNVFAANCCPEDIRSPTAPGPTGPWTYRGQSWPRNSDVRWL
ncbi:hypothetical protein B0T26DRAFT_446517 [Lasiosphaeria miniovina]|uniref:Uncharacterized protein n=1 Tax=Lasiosphaeria miniovina TaxID=1954250 RepID=A0AA40DMI1_9PEZI|nr:uncharacterized protein B0T26DRAFT_446517 [Lasiosphaeria miniovina]KAK0706267.1 hypothetical protein B0T26DRAFT_446517 [Lasiosphaeria miniovina]